MPINDNFLKKYYLWSCYH